MPSVSSSGATIAYDVHGDPGAPPLLFINSIGTRRELWDAQRRALEPSYRVIQYDARGHGQSSVPPGDYTIAQLGQDALAILDAERLAAAQICGISLGGLTALWLAVHAPERVRALVLANTGARIGSVESWTARIALVREGGMKAVADLAMPLWFTDGFRAREAATVRRFRDMVEACPVDGYLGCCAALRDEDLRDALGSVGCPVLAVAGSHDRATAPELLEFVHERLPRSRLVTLDAAHLSNVEQDAAFNASLSAFLAAQV
ncbi:MAG TPA: 3-oxoadipate enol-lactonase [Vicinamibacterales bacterium]|nr:3-oxoadipate enol-lactonase [Vicinamibacterales bacterium]